MPARIVHALSLLYRGVYIVIWCDVYICDFLRVTVICRHPKLLHAKQIATHAAVLVEPSLPRHRSTLHRPNGSR
jgi:hypothetical protein